MPATRVASATLCLVAAGAGVQQQHDQGGVAAGLEAVAGARLEQPLEPVVGHDRDRLVRHDRRPHEQRWVGGDLAFLQQPGVQDLEDLVVGGGGGGLPAGEQVGHEASRSARVAASRVMPRACRNRWAWRTACR
jgi:hypothetical protein